MSSRRDESFERYLRAAIALQYMQEKVSNVNFHVPHLALIGMQSAGKTRMLSYFAGRKIGGAEKSQTGTRCPVVYEFQVGTDAARFGTKDRMEDIEPRKIHEKVSAHMRGLEAKGFDEEPIFVKLSGPRSLNAVIVDLPGVVPKGNDNADTVNLTIGKMIKKYVNDPSTIPLVISSIPINLDMTYLSGDLSQLLFYCCDDMEAMKSLTRRALLLVSRLDTINRTMRTANLHEFIAKVEKEFGFNPDRVIFLSLMPELLDANTNEPLVDASTASYDEMTQYFETTAPAAEKELLPHFLRSLGINPTEFNFGVDKCKAEIEATLVNAMRSNMASAFEKMGEEMRNIKQECNELLKNSGDTSFKELIIEYVSLAADMLSGTATNDSSRITTAMQKAYQRHWETSTISLDDETFAVELIDNLRRSFEKERKDVATVAPNVASIAFIYDNHTMTELKSKKNGKENNFIKTLEGKLSGDSAISRVVTLFGFAIMVKKLKVFKPDDIINDANFADNNSVRGMRTANVLRKMVYDLRVKASWFKALISWCTAIFSSQARAVCNELSKRSKLLENYPKLLVYLNQMIEAEYTDALHNASREIEEQAARVVNHRYETMKIDELTAAINLLGCCGLTRSLLQKEDTEEWAEITKGAGLKEAVDSLAKIAVDTLPPPMKAAVKLVGRIADDPVEHVHHTFDFFAEVVQVSPYEFAMLEGLKFFDLKREDVYKKLDELNATAQMIARFNSGMAFQDVATMIESHLVRMTQQLHHEIRLHVMTRVNRLLNDPKYEAQLWQLKNEDRTIEQKRVLLERIAIWLDAADRLNECEEGSAPLDTTKARRLAGKLEREMRLDEQKRAEARHPNSMPSSAEAKKTPKDSDDESGKDSDDDDVDNDQPFSDAMDNETRSVLTIEKLKSENARLKRRIEKLQGKLAAAQNSSK